MKFTHLLSAFAITGTLLGTPAAAQSWDTVMTGISKLSFTGLYPDCTEVLHVSGNTILGTTTAGIYRSTDYGDHWKLRTVNAQGYNGARLVKGGRILGLGLPVMTGMYSIAISDDGGDTWTNSSSGLPSGLIVEDLVQTPDDKIYIACRKPAAVYVSSDNGATWTSKSTGIATAGTAALWSIEAIDNNTLVAGASSGFYRTTDAGATWTLVKGTGTDYVTALRKHPNGTLYAGLTSNQVMRSTDNGLSWANTSMTGSSAMVYDIEIDKSQNIYVGVFNTGILKFAADETPLGNISTTAMGMTYPRIQDIMIDESGSSPIYMAATMSTGSINGLFYRSGYTGTNIRNTALNPTNFIVYPNPAHSSLRIAGVNGADMALINIYSIDGRKISEAAFTETIEIGQLAAGQYVLQLIDKNGVSGTQLFEKN